MSEETPKPGSKWNMKPVLLALSPTLVLLLGLGLSAVNVAEFLIGWIMVMTYLVYCPAVCLTAGFMLTNNPQNRTMARLLKGLTVGAGFLVVNYIIAWAGCSAMSSSGVM